MIEPNTSPEAGLRKRPTIVLVVEPDPANSTSLAGLLKKLGFQSTLVTTLAAARKFLVTATPHIMILNLLLADGNGMDLLAEVHRGKRPIIVAVVAAVTQQLNLNELMALKPNAVFGNPVDIGDFHDWLGRQIPDA